MDNYWKYLMCLFIKVNQKNYNGKLVGLFFNLLWELIT